MGIFNFQLLIFNQKRVSDGSGKPTVSGGASEASVNGTRTCSGRSDLNEEMENSDDEGGAVCND